MLLSLIVQRRTVLVLGTRYFISDSLQIPSIRRHLPTAFISSSSKRRQTLDDSGDQTIKKKGVIVGKSALKIRCEEGKTYSWCSCGLSLKQPLCDGSHKKSSCGLKPVRFIAPETKDYFLCNCKQTNKPPFCDGTHKKL